jgi:membrane protein YqaA with SNARE-associated domain
LGVFGLFLAAILDSSPFPTLGGLDILIAILAARHAEPWYYYAAVATAGSIIGAYITFHAAHRGGSEYLQRRFGKSRVSQFLALFERWGTGGLVVSASVPFPFPTSALFAAAGVLKYPLRRFLIVVTISRAARYASVAAIASHYGRHFVRLLRNPSQYYGWLIAIAVALAMMIFVAAMMRRRMQAPA